MMRLQVMPGVSGTLSLESGCTIPDSLAGWCVSPGGKEATVLELLGSCDTVKEGCETWTSGEFQPMGECISSSSPSSPIESEASSGSGFPHGAQTGAGGSEGTECTIAPGPMGAAHQLGTSSGYGNDCQGTPAQQSPFMWPAAWTAKVESKAMNFDTGATSFTSSGRVWYRLDKNWKRSDIHFQEGIQFTVGQSPCPEEDRIPGSPNKCRRHPRNSTMLHRGSKMVFLEYAPEKFSAADIVNCTVLDMGVIGNVRPDWFMDNRGVSTDVQYIGNSHVYYLGEPTLVKQWRKQDFASQYFTMSMSGYPGEDGIHWPLIMYAAYCLTFSLSFPS